MFPTPRKNYCTYYALMYLHKNEKNLLKTCPNVVMCGKWTFFATVQDKKKAKASFSPPHLLPIQLLGLELVELLGQLLLARRRHPPELLNRPNGAEGRDELRLLMSSCSRQFLSSFSSQQQERRGGEGGGRGAPLQQERSEEQTERGKRHDGGA